jgi:hypothetical protein
MYVSLMLADDSQFRSESAKRKEEKTSSLSCKAVKAVKAVKGYLIQRHCNASKEPPFIPKTPCL